MKHFKITPDARLDNSNVEHFARTLCNFKSMFERMDFKARQVKSNQFLSYEIRLKPEDTGFFVSCLPESEQVVKNAVEGTWKRVSVERVSDPFNKPPTLLSYLTYKYHYTFALRVDKRKSGILNSLLDVLHIMTKEDEAYIQILCHPAHSDWYSGAVEGYERFKDGHMPQKWHFNKKNIARTILKAATKATLGLIDAVAVMATGQNEMKINLDEGERAIILKDGTLRSETITKTKGDAYETNIRIGVVCSDPKRAEAIKRMICLSFRELDGDNSLVEIPQRKQSFKRMQERKRGVQMQKDYMSVSEVARMLCLPTGAMQESYKIPSISNLEVKVPNHLLNGGMLLGHHEFKRQTQDIFFPTDNWDELCLPAAIVGGMGQGKTKGYGANLLVEAFKNGFGGLCIDPAKGELGDEIEAAIGKENVIRYKLGEQLVSIDWRESEHAKRGKNRLATTILEFFGSDDTGGQTQRFLRAGIMAMQTTKLSELQRMFEDMKYLKQCVDKMPKSIHSVTLNGLMEYKDARRRQILDPIYNRLDQILGDEYLAECFETDQGVDLVDLMSKKKIIVFDVPKSLLGIDGVELVVKLLTTKIDLAMTLRKEENQFPFFVVYDEPHQFMKSTDIWERAAVESRKWRVAFRFMFHDFAQLGKEFREILKSGGCHFHLYPSSKKTFELLREEISPYTIEDALKLKSHHTINVIRSGGEIVKPFIMKMTPPPKMRKKVTNLKK